MSKATGLQGTVALVTGARGGVGGGIVDELTAAGACVYGTVRTNPHAPADQLSIGIDDVRWVACDQGDDSQLMQLVERIRREQGRLDILVNNAFPTQAIVAHPGPDIPGGMPFWQVPADVWTAAFDIGVRAHCMLTAYAMPLLAPAKGLVVNISSGGARVYYASTPYGLAKAALDRFSRDAAREARVSEVTIVSLWPGMVRTKLQETLAASQPDATVGYVRAARAARREAFELSSLAVLPETSLDAPEITLGEAWGSTESPQFTGRAVVALALDPERLARSGRALSVAGLARDYGFYDVDGACPDAFGYADDSVWFPLQ